MGYTSFDDADGQSGWAMICKMGVDYMLPRHIGVGIEAAEYRGFFSEPEGWNMQHSDEYYGVSQIGIMAGLRIYL